MEPFVEQLKRICAEHPTRAKWVFVPSHAVGHTLGDGLVLDGTDWANLRFVTPLDIALRMGAPFLVERGIDPSEEGLGPALIMSLLLKLGDEHGYFRPLASQPELSRALWSTITELRMAGVGPKQLSDAAFESTAKRDELCALLQSYETFLTNKRRGDRATVFDEALKHPDWCPIQNQDCWAELPDTIWSPLERRLFDSIPGERLSPETLQLPGATSPRRLSGSNAIRIEPRNALFAHLLEPGTQEPRNPEPTAPVSFFQAGGAEAEIEEVFRRILAAGATLDDVEICVASPPSQPLAWEKCLRYDWPVTMADGIPAAMTRPGRALVAFAEWVEDDFAAGRLRKMLQSGDVRLPDSSGLSPARAARLLVKAQAAWGRETYGLSLGKYARTSRLRADRDDLPQEERDRLKKAADQCDELALWINRIIDAVPQFEEGAGQRTGGWASEPGVSGSPPGASGPGNAETIPLKSLVTCASTFITTHAACASALDHVAAGRIADALNELYALGDFRCTLQQGLGFLNERASSVIVGADRPRPGHLHVSTLRRAALSHRRFLFVIGLEEGRVFPSAFEDPILLDSERETIDASLIRSGDRIDEAVFAAVGRLAAASASNDVSITLSYSCRDLREFRSTYASWLMLQAFRSSSGNPAATYKNLHEHLGAPKSCVPELAAQALGPSRWWLHGVTEAGPTSRPAVLAHYSELAHGASAAEARASTLFTEFDGFVPEAGTVLDPASPARVISPTQLEDAASCPFRHFLRRGLNVDAIESGDRDREVWLNPLLRGSLLHDLYARLMRRCRDGKRKVMTPSDCDWLVEEGKSVLADLTREMPPPSAEVGDREAQDFLEDLLLFAEAEAQANGSNSTPLGFEVGFGRGGSDEGESLTQIDPVVVNLGGGLSLRIAGRIDRIDQVGALADATFEIVDYKTGGYYAPAWKGTFAGGTRLQHALYSLAVVELLKKSHKKPRVTGATYYFTSAKGKQARKHIPLQPIAKVTEVLSDLREVIANGVFVHAHDEDSCKWCDYGHACGKNAHDVAQNKHLDLVLAPFLKLVSHE
jgi:hypothetical protein